MQKDTSSPLEQRGHFTSQAEQTTPSLTGRAGGGSTTGRSIGGGSVSSRQPLPSLHGRGWGWVFLWSHRRQNGWVFAEILLITVLSFFFIDQIAVSTYDKYFCRPAGDFEREHLLVAQTGQTPSPLPLKGEDGHLPDAKYDSQQNTSLSPSEGERGGGLSSLYALRDRIRALPEVQYAGLTGRIVGQGSYHLGSYASEGDSTHHCRAYMQYYTLHEQFIEALGLTPIEGSPSARVLSEECPEGGVVITRSLAQAIFDTDQVVGRRMVEWDFSDRALQEHGEPVIVSHYTIAGVVEDFRLQENDRYAYSILNPSGLAVNITPKMLIRLHPEVDVQAFLNQLTSPASQALRQVGDRILVSVQTYKDWQKKGNGPDDYTLTNTLLGILLALFLLNVVLGTLGTFWLQLRKRTEDIGIMRSFGAKRRDIFLMVWGEAALLTLLACIVGQLIWFQFAISMDFSPGLSMSGTGRERNWVEIFWLHYLVICVVQYLLMLAVVTLAIIVPTWRAAHLRPVDALRHE